MTRSTIIIRTFWPKCSGCNQPIPATEYVMRSQNNVFHLHCFACVICQKRLEKGEQYVPFKERLFCRNHDYEATREKEMAQLQHSSHTSKQSHDLFNLLKS